MSTLTRRDFIKMAGLGVVTPLTVKSLSPGWSMDNKEITLYVGTYTRGASKGIYRCTMDTSSGAVEVDGVTEGVVNPSFLAIDSSRRFLYSVGETDHFNGRSGGSVHAFSIDQATGELQLLNTQSSGGEGPCYITVAPEDRHVFTANYSGGSVTLLPVRRDGSLGASSDVIQHEGSSVHPQRQQEPHPHCVVLDKDGNRAFVADLGLDRIMIYEFDARKRSLASGDHPWAELAPGAGPRHLTFHPDGKRVYVINELDSTLTVFAYDARRGMLEESQTVSTLPSGYTGDNYPADVHVAASGRYVYGSNRGHDSIVVFAVAADSGVLTPIQHQSTGGEGPRNFVLDPTGQFLLAANQDSDNIVTFAIDSTTGKLTPTGHVTEVPTPVCLQFLSVHSGIYDYSR